MLIVWCLLVLWHPSAPVGRRHGNVLLSVAAIAIYRNPVTRAMRNVEAFSQSFTNRPPTRRLFRAHAASMSRPCRVDVRRTSAGFRPDAVKPGFHGV